MKELVRRFYQPQYLVKEHLKLGDIPSTKEGYSTALSTSWAAIAETFLIALIGMADTLMVSGIGPQAVSAVGVVTQPRYLAQTLVLALNVSITSICARRKGEGNQESAVSVLKQGLMISLVSSLVLSALFLPFAGNLIRFMGAKGDSVTLATEYFIILLCGLPIHNTALTISSAQRGVGETKASMWINMSANIVNIIFNFLLINGIGPFPRLGVKGAAIATVMGWAVSLVIAILTVSKKDQFLHLGDSGRWVFDKLTLASMYKVGFGSFLEQVCLRFGFMMYAKVITGLGTVIHATHEILTNMMSLSFSFGEGFGIAASSLIGQNLGAKRPDLSIVYGKICQRMSLITSGILFVFFSIFGVRIASVFIRQEEALAIIPTLFMMMGLILFAQSSQMVFMGSLRGAGDTKYTAVISMVCILLLRTIVGYFFAYTMGLGLVGAWIGLMVDQFVRLFLTERRFSSGKWTKIIL